MELRIWEFLGRMILPGIEVWLKAINKPKEEEKKEVKIIVLLLVNIYGKEK